MSKLLPHKLLSGLSLSLGLSLGMLLSAGPVSAASDKLTPQVAEALVTKSGLADQLPAIAPSVATGLTTNPGFASNLGEAELQIVLRAFSNAYAPTRLATDITAELPGQLKAAPAQDALKWLESDLGRKITALEDAASKQASDPSVMEQAQETYQRLSPRRAERYERLVKASEVAESSTQLLINTSIGTAYGVASTTGSTTPPDIDAIRREIERNREEMTDTLRGQFSVLFSSAYQTLSEAELDQYIAFMESPSGRAYNKAMAAAIDKAMVKAAKDAGRQIGDAVRQKKAQTPA